MYLYQFVQKQKDCSRIVFSTTLSAENVKDCESMNVKGYEAEYKACLKISSPKKIEVNKGNPTIKDCESMNVKGYEAEYKACLKISSPKKIEVNKGNPSIKDCESMNVKGYEAEYKACLIISTKAASNCEEVTEQYAICNGVRYVLDLKNNDSLKRDIKKIEDYIDSEKPNSGSNAVLK
jgi:hypothetical protein